MDPLGMKASTSGLGRVGASGDEAFCLKPLGLSIQLNPNRVQVLPITSSWLGED